MDYLGRLPVQTNLHLIITPQECNALFNAVSFFHAFFKTEHDIDISEWNLIASDEPLQLYDQLASKLATLP